MLFVISYFRATQQFYYHTTKEAQSRLKEVLACGKPVIVNDVGDMKEYIVEGKNGFIVEAGNHQQVA